MGDINFSYLIPIVAILAGTFAGMFKEWLKFKKNQRELGTATDHLEKVVEDLRARDQEMQRRLENLEAIVVSQTWDAVTDKTLPPPVKELRVASVAQREMSAPVPHREGQGPDTERAEALARRLRA